MKWILLLLLLLTGCAEQEEDFLIISEGNNPPSEAVQYMYTPELLAKDVALFWNEKRYDILYDLFDSEFQQNYTKDAFVFLAEKDDTRLRINSIKVTKVTADSISFEIDRDRYLTKTTVNIKREEDDLKIEPFYFFKEFDVLHVCQRVSIDITYEECGISFEEDKTLCEEHTNFKCIFDYAQANKEEQYCDATGPLKTECFRLLGVKISKKEQIESCFAQEKESSQASCLSEFAGRTKDVEFCLAIPWEELQFRCIGNVAGRTKDVSLCDYYAHQYAFNQFKLLACYADYAKVTGDTRYCESIDPGKDPLEGALREECSHY